MSRGRSLHNPWLTQDFGFQSFDVELDLSAYAGNSIQLQFNYTGNDGASATLDDILVEAYKGKQTFNANENIFDIKPESQLSFGISLAPTYQQQITKNIGITLGLDYYLSLTSFMSNKAFNENDQLFVGEDFGDRTASVLEDYFESNRLGKLSAKAGVLIRF